MLAEAVSAGTRIIWGAVPTTPPPLPSTVQLAAAVRRAEAWLLAAGADVRRLAEAWITPACGLSGLSISHAEQVATRTRDVAGVLRG